MATSDFTKPSVTFVGKLYNMLENPQIQHLMHWTESGESFVVENPEEFSRTILPQFFKHGKFASFVRQLNMYDFHKVTEFIPPHAQGMATSPDQIAWEFQHSKFKRGRPDLVAEIKRKIPRSAEIRRTERLAHKVMMGAKPHHFPTMTPAQASTMLPSGLHVTSASAGLFEKPSSPLITMPERLSFGTDIGKQDFRRTTSNLATEHRIVDLEDKVRQLHENWGLLWNELVNCRQQLQGEHQVLQNMTQFLASAFATEEKDAKRSLETSDADRQKEEEQRRYSLVLQGLYYGVPHASLVGTAYNHGSIGGLVGTDTNEGQIGSLTGNRPFDDYFGTWPSYGTLERKEQRPEHRTSSSTLRES